MGQLDRVPKGRVRLAIDFRDAEQLLEFVDDLKRAYPDHFSNADAFAKDGLDDLSGGGITDGNTYIFKNARDRIPGSSLRDALDKKVSK
jgi:hypothetical protein